MCVHGFRYQRIRYLFKNFFLFLFRESLNSVQFKKKKKKKGGGGGGVLVKY